MTMHVNVSGVWKEITDPQVNVSGVWKDILEGWVNVSGVWKKFYDRVVVACTPDSFSQVAFSPSSATVSFTFQRDGDLVVSGIPNPLIDADDWITPRSATVGDDYEIRVTLDSGVSLDSGTVGSWLALSSNRTWTQTRVSTGNDVSNITIEIRRAASGSVLLSKAVSVTASVI